jgi:hypothetical protein
LDILSISDQMVRLNPRKPKKEENVITGGEAGGA